MKEESIQKALRGIDGVSKFMSKREIKELPSLLWEDELPEALATGRYNNGNGLLVATNKRAIFIDKGLMSLRVEDFPYDRMSSIEYKTGLLAGEISLYTMGNRARITSVPKAQVRDFAEFLRARVTVAVSNPSIPPEPAAASGQDTVSLLERLANLKAQGVLTDAEFEEQKAKLLGG